MTTAALYARVSSDEQAERYGLAGQLADLRALATSRGYVVPEGAEFVDDGYSGATLERPQLTRLREALRAGAFEVVLIHDPDRLARKLAFQALLLDEFERQARVEFVTEDHADSPSGRLLRNVRGAIAEFEREKIRERTQRGRRERLRAGLTIFTVAPYGYRLEGARGERLLVNDTEAATVRMIFQWLVQEQRSLRSIAGELQRLGIPTRHGAKWRISTVRKILTNPIYRGEATFTAAGESITLGTPVLVAREVWDAAHDQLVRNIAVIRGRPPKRFYLLTGLLRCGVCGRRMSGMGSEGRYYECTNRDVVIGEGCRTRAHRTQVEALVWESVAAILRDPDTLAERFEVRLQRLGAREAKVRSEGEHLRQRLAELDTREERLLALYLDAELPDEVKQGKVKEKLADLVAQRRALTERIAAVDAAAAGAGAERARQQAIRQYCAIARRGLDRLSPEGRQQLLRGCVDAVIVRGRHIEIQGFLPGRTGTSPGGRENVHTNVSEFKRRLIEATLHQVRGNRTHAARALGLQRTYLLRLIRELDVAVPPPPERRRIAESRAS